MEEFGESLEELQEKLEKHKQDLQTVEAVLPEHDDQEVLLKLQSDLKEVILLTEDLIRSHDTSGVAAGSWIDEGGTVPENNASSKRGEAALDASGMRMDPGLNSSMLSQSVDTTKVNARELKLQTLVGRTCQALYEGHTYFAEIIGIQKDAKVGECAVLEFIGYGNRELYALQQIQLLPVCPIDLCMPGTRAQGLYSKDGRWYACKILEASPSGCLVVYTDFANTEELPFDRVRLMSASHKEGKSKVKEVVTPGGYRIPEYLQIKETDTDAQKLSKKKRIQLLKKKQRVEQSHEVANTRANSWRKFNTKATNKKVSGYLTGRGHQSIFKSVDDLEAYEAAAATKSQAANTFVPRRKHDFEECDEE